MSDNKDTVKSKISMDLKNRKNKKAVDTAPLDEDTKKTAATDTHVSAERPIKDTSHNATSTAKEPLNSTAHHPHLETSKQTLDALASKRLKVLVLVLCMLPILTIAASILISHYKDSAHYYYVESTIAPPSELETSTSALVLGSCVVDFTKKATPDELTQMVFDEYGYKKNDEDFVQTIVNTGCDTSLSLPKITNGSALKAMF